MLMKKITFKIEQNDEFNLMNPKIVRVQQFFLLTNRNYDQVKKQNLQQKFFN